MNPEQTIDACIKTFQVAPGVSVKVASYEDHSEESPFILDLSIDPIEEAEYQVKVSYRTPESRDIAFISMDEAQAVKYYEKALKAVNGFIGKS